MKTVVVTHQELPPQKIPSLTRLPLPLYECKITEAFLRALRRVIEVSTDTGDLYFLFRVRRDDKDIDSPEQGDILKPNGTSLFSVEGEHFLSDEVMHASNEEDLPSDLTQFFGLEEPFADVLRDPVKFDLLVGNKEGPVREGLWGSDAEHAAMRRVNARYGIRTTTKDKTLGTYEERLRAKVMANLSRALPEIIQAALEDVAIEDAAEGS